MRRLSFDLLGLPPSAEEVSDFEKDASPLAWEAQVDRSLNDPSYGKRWGRHWLDVARYADAKGYVDAGEPPFPFAYTYRDYVVDAFNSDKPYPRFILEQLKAEGVDTSKVITDQQRLTALVLLGIRNSEQFPLIFYRENCADMALSTNDIDENFISRAKCICVTGTHLSNANVEGATLKALSIAKKLKKKTVLDIDFRPNLWGLSDHNDGENRFIESRHVTKKLQKTLKLFDLIVGTEEEFHIAGGINNTIKALKNVRSLTKAVLVCKRGPYGASLFENKIRNIIAKITKKQFGGTDLQLIREIQWHSTIWVSFLLMVMLFQLMDD